MQITIAEFKQEHKNFSGSGTKFHKCEYFLLQIKKNNAFVTSLHPCYHIILLATNDTNWWEAQYANLTSCSLPKLMQDNDEHESRISVI